LEYHFLLARDLTSLEDGEYQELNRGVVEIKKILGALMSKVDAERFAS
jgi:hypothetical protein